MAKKTKEPFELVIHIDEDGTRAVASYRIRQYDEDDETKLVATEMESVRLETLGDQFPWTEFTGKATKAALLKAEATDQLQADLDAEKAKVMAAEAEVEKHKTTIADRDALLLAALNESRAIAQGTINVANALDAAIKARQPQSATSPTPTKEEEAPV